MAHLFISQAFVEHIQCDRYCAKLRDTKMNVTCLQVVSLLGE